MKDKSCKVRPTRLNMLHTAIRNANALGLEQARDRKYREYKTAGGKRSLKQLLVRRPIYVK